MQNLVEYFVICFIVWATISVIFFRKELQSFFLSSKEKKEQKSIAVAENSLMGAAHDVFQTVGAILKDEENSYISISEGDFEIEYDSIDNEATYDDDDDIQETVNSENLAVDFQEMQQMIAIVEDDTPVKNLGNTSIEEAKRTLKQIEDTDFLKKMMTTKDEVSRRIDEILNNNINN
ncbi:MAG: hypothetical protein LBR10_15990 [Prevotellaceae bacterium]|jgi:hypothetical protein|nr:hypothetical protein [Prevotellaceae bacterium]